MLYPAHVGGVGLIHTPHLKTFFNILVLKWSDGGVIRKKIRRLHIHKHIFFVIFKLVVSVSLSHPFGTLN